MIRGLVLALQFLSRLPIGIGVDFSEENIRKSTFFYPYVGMVLGAISSLPYWLLSKYSVSLASFLSLASMVILTGGLHLDGLSDSADGFFSNKDREGILLVMKDSRIGAYGVLSLIFLIMGKYIVLTNFKEGLGLALILSMANSRLVVLLQIAYKKVARPGGLGDMVHKSQPRNYVVMAILTYLALLALIDIRYFLPLLASFLLGELISIYSYKKIGGFTGDLYGAVIELMELASLFVFWGILQWI